MTFLSTKKYGHEIGMSACFRQWKAGSHCQFLHGYALAFKFIFETEKLNERNWVVDFGGLKSLKSILEQNFDHKTIVAEDDPHITWYMEGDRIGTMDVIVMPANGCEKFAEYVYVVAEQWLKDSGFSPRCRLVSVEVSEHGANSAIFVKE